MTRPDPVLEKWLQEQERKLLRAQTDMTRIMQQPRRGSAGEALLFDATAGAFLGIGQCPSCSSVFPSWSFWFVDRSFFTNNLDSGFVELVFGPPGSSTVCGFTDPNAIVSTGSNNYWNCTLLMRSSVNEVRVTYVQGNASASYTIVYTMPLTDFDCTGVNVLDYNSAESHDDLGNSLDGLGITFDSTITIRGSTAY